MYVGTMSICQCTLYLCVTDYAAYCEREGLESPETRESVQEAA